jgi:LysR family transcriptional regulator, regulator for bpeEF and oprC
MAAGETGVIEVDRLAAMQTFVRVVEAGTFTKAADLMNLPKATVTRNIQTLEQHLQTQLLNRTTRRVTVTADGAAYYERALRVLSEIDELESSMTRAKANPRGRLRIDVPASIGQLMLIPALPDFHARYPDIQIDLGVSDRPVDLIGENVDCVVRGGEITDLGLIARRIGEFHTVLGASPGYVQRHGVPKHPHDLEDGPHLVINYFSHRTGKPYPFTFTKGAERVEIGGRHILSVNDSGANVAAAVAGLGIARIATFQARHLFESGALVPLLLDWCADTIPIHVVYPPNRHLSTKLRVFVDWVADLFSKSPLIQKQCCLPCEANGVPARAAVNELAVAG